MGPVFIIGFSRTGSTMLQNILNSYTNIAIFPEMHIYWPPWIHTDFATNVKKRIGYLSDNKIDQLIQLMYSKKLFGIFWKNIDKIDIDVSYLKERITGSDRSVAGIFDALLNTLSKSYNDKIVGAKFPVHFSYADKLLEWYPDCKIIHTIRDPRAIYSSQFYKHYNEDYSGIKRMIISIAQFAHVTFSFNGVVKVHEKMKHYGNYYLCNYEKLVSQPQIILRELCDFLEIEFNDAMLRPRLFFNTSLARKQMSNGFHTFSVDAWKRKLPRGVSCLIKLVDRRSMMKVGYH